MEVEEERTRYNRNATLRKNLQELKALTPIYDMRPRINRKVVIRDSADPGQVLDAIYQVRCNLVHGPKIMDNQRDYMLVELSFLILDEIISPLLKTIK